MILLVTPVVKAQNCAEALQNGCGEPVQVSCSLQQAIMQLRAQEYSAVVIDEALSSAQPDEADIVLQQIGTAVPVFVNFAICGIDRVTRELRAALCRRKREVMVARRTAEQILRSELKGTVTALLLSCEMALQVDNLPGPAEAKIRMVYELAREVRTKLGATA